MDELEISGKRYISTRLAGKEHKYHADYIGQLIRGGKVAGQKVGRSWYVDAESLAAYLSAESVPRSHVPKTKKESDEVEPKKKVVKAAAPRAPQEVVAEPEEVFVADEPAGDDELEASAEPVEETVRAQDAQEEVPQAQPRLVHLMPRPLQAHATPAPEQEEKPASAAEPEPHHSASSDDEHRVPIKVTMPRLRYVSSEKSILPEISEHKAERNVSHAKAELLREAPPQEAAVRSEVERLPRRRVRILAPALTLLITGVLIVLASAFVSVYLVSVTTVKTGQPASTGYAFSMHSTSF